MRAQLTRRGSVLAAVVALTATSTADAQVSTIFQEQWDLGFEFSRTSARRAAMGSVSVAIADETSEIDMWDYGRNVAGFLYDRDAWTGDFWAQTASRNRSVTGVGSSGDTIESGVQLSFRNYQRALGIEGALTSSRYEVDSGAETRKFDGPRVSIVANQAIGESIVLGVGLTVINENEKVSSSNPLATARDTARRDWLFGLVFYPTDRLEIGASATLSDNVIRGTSEDGFHRDKSTWDRPVTDFGGQAIYFADAFTVAGFVSRSRLDGGEILDVSWSREFFLNPSGVDLAVRVPVLDEELNETAAGARVMIRAGERVELGASAAFSTGDYVATVNPTFPTLVSTTDREFSGNEFIAGATVRPLRRVAVVGEFVTSTEERDDIVLEDLQTTTDERSGFRAGVEIFWRPSITVRGGAQVLTDSEDFTSSIGSRFDEFDRTRWSAGLGWSPRGGMFQMDGALMFTDSEGSGDAASDDSADGLSFVLTARSLFR